MVYFSTTKQRVNTSYQKLTQYYRTRVSRRKKNHRRRFDASSDITILPNPEISAGLETTVLQDEGTNNITCVITSLMVGNTNTQTELSRVELICKHNNVLQRNIYAHDRGSSE